MGLIIRIPMTETERRMAWKATDFGRAKYMRTNFNDIKRALNAQKHAAARAALRAASVDDIKAHVSDAVDRTRHDMLHMFTRVWMRTAPEFARRTYNVVKSRKAEPAMATWMASVTRIIQKQGAAKVVGVNDTTKKRIGTIVDDGIARGLGMRDIAKEIDGVKLSPIIANRSMVIARTETIAASNFGSQEGARSTGLTLNKQWISTNDDRTRDDHIVADGQIVALDEGYNVGGESLAYPGDQSGAPENIINCRCTEAYITVD